MKTSMKLYLLDIEKNLFPEHFPFYKQNFKAEKDFINQNRFNEDCDLKNIAFKIRLVRLSMKIKDPQMKEDIFVLYDKMFPNVFCYETAYDWRDLKVLLCFFILFWDTPNFKALEKRVLSPHVPMLLRKYFLTCKNLKSAQKPQ